MDDHQKTKITLFPTTEACVGLDANSEPVTCASRLKDFEEAETRAIPGDILELPNNQQDCPPGYWIAWKNDNWISAPSLSELVALL